MSKKLQTPETYDAMFSEGGSDGVFDLPYRRSGYYPLFRMVARLLRQRTPRTVLEVGCGTGAMAHLLFDETKVAYQGFDFSPLAVDKARSRTGREAEFFVADATAASSYAGRHYEAIVCTEVLEHVENDREAIALWAPGTWCVCSVPNYDADTHVRLFRSEEEVRARYGDLIDIQQIKRLNKPFLNDLTRAGWWRAVRWNRYRVDRLLWLMGISDFDRDGGWFVFAGVKR